MVPMGVHADMKTLLVLQAAIAWLDDFTVAFDPYCMFQGKMSDPGACRAFLRERFDHEEPAVFLACLAGCSIAMAQIYSCFSSSAPDARRP